MHSADTRRSALALRGQGLTLSEISRLVGVSRSTLRTWRSATLRVEERCPRCGPAALAHGAYAALLGYYLGDGHISRAARYDVLRVSCDARLPQIIDDVESCVALVGHGRVFRVRAPGCIVVQAHWTHWTCLFPQHGPGRKHERVIALEDWQRVVVADHPDDFLRGLFHSDGSRFINWTRRPVAGVLKRYEYPRWQFTNASEDILGLCGWALDLVDVAWRRSSAKHISVSRREAVARLDELIGLKA